MKSTHLLAALSLAVLLLGTSMSATAGEGHDHGDAAPAAAGTALPRFAAVSETFELVGVLDGKTITEPGPDRSTTIRCGVAPQPAVTRSCCASRCST